MATIADRQPGAQARPARPRREGRGALTGLVAAALLALALALIALTNPPIGDETPQRIAGFYHDTGKQTLLGMAGVAVILAGFCFLWFLGSLRASLRRAEGDPGRLSSLALVAGAVAMVLVWLGFSVFGAIPAALSYNPGLGYDAALDQHLHAVLGALTYHCLAQAGAAAAVMVGATALLVRRTGAFPRWFGNTSAAIAVLLLLSGLLGLAGLGVGVALLAVWVALASAVSLPTGRAQPSTTIS